MPDEFTTQALALVDAYIADHAECSRQGVDQPFQGSTNRVIFIRRGRELLVCKIFCETERKSREAFALRHWQPTGLVPRIIADIGDRMLIMSYIPGAHLLISRQIDGESAFISSCREVGRATATLAQVPLPEAQRCTFESQFYPDLPTLESYLNRIISLGRAITQRDPDFRDPFWHQSLAFIATQLPAIYAQPRILYHQDIGNLHVQQGRFMGFYDLEMCRVGTASIQLGAALGYIADEPTLWPTFREGWEEATGHPLTPSQLRSAAAIHHLLCWRVISRYLSYNGTPGTGHPWADPANPATYRRSIQTVHKTLRSEYSL